MDVIEVEGLTKSFGNICAVKNVSFELKEGDIMGYLGPNGAGKTTTMRLLLGILKPDSGTIRLWGDKWSKEKLSKVGVLMEQDGLYNTLNCEENLRYWGEIFGMSKKAIEERIDELLKYMDLTGRSRDPVKTLSKGMRRKLAIARALMHDPELLILDEPTSGLDPEAQIMVRETLSKLAKERKTILLSSHNLSDVEKVVSVIGIIKKGELKFFDKIESAKLTEKEIVRIRVDDPDKAKRAIKDLAEDIEVGDKEIRVTVKKNLSEVVSTLTNSGVKVEEVVRETKSLEKLYLEVINE